jgi:hypothetical protein
MAEDSSEQQGTLVVTYQAEQQEERFKRIRFRLSDQQGQETLYPRKDAFIDNPTSLARIVVIKGLTPGLYSLEFLIPNKDHFFEIPALREVMIIAGKTTIVDQIVESHKMQVKEKSLSKSPMSFQDFLRVVHIVTKGLVTNP